VHRTPDRAATIPAPRSNAAPWWRTATVYRAYLPSFADGNGDGIGDLIGLRERAGYLVLLGVDAVSLSGLLTQPDPRSGATAPGIDRAAGGLPELDAFIGEAHDQGLKVILEGPAGVVDGMERTLRFWLDRGIDGFRAAGGDKARLRRLLDEYPARALVGTVDTNDDAAGPQQRLQYEVARSGWNSAALTAAVNHAMGGGETPTWVLSDRGLQRPASRHGAGPLGERRARALALLQLALPGAVEICAGDELALPDVVGLDLRDDSWVPLPWAGEKPPYEFTRQDASWLPIPEGWVDRTVESQLEDAGSMLSLYRQALELRQSSPAASGDGIEWYGAPDGCLALRRTGGLICAVNTTTVPVPLPPGTLLLSSVPLVDGSLPGDATAWLS
jgi:alpha-glucosidase